MLFCFRGPSSSSSLEFGTCIVVVALLASLKFLIHVGQEQAEFWLDGLNASMEDVMRGIDSLSIQHAYSYPSFEIGDLLELLQPYKVKVWLSCTTVWQY